MPSNRSPLAHDYLRDLLDRALDEPHGLKVTCKSHGEAMALRAKLNYYRSRDRTANAKTYPEDHPLRHASIWERLTCVVGREGAPDEAVLTIKQTPVDHLIIESLGPEPD